ncbi:MAG TPA: delta-lactam-biosynthetic de-N-acetylase [Clostridiaceae bacterium]|nr:delta-lactam-biosynthetic de-N-acetylase [Clostridiaceae bacterium]
MKITRFIAISLVFFILLAGCGRKPKSTETSNGTTTQGTTGTTSDSTNGNPDETTPNETLPGQTEEASEEPTGPVQPEPANRTPQLDTELLDKLDNTTKGWWIQLNSDHETPYIPKDIKELIAKYDAYYVADTSEKVVYLTFDEGYENGYTPLILDTLKENDVQAVFFITSQYIKQNADLIQRMLDEGHIVGNHSVNHPSLPDKDYEGIIKEICGLEEMFEEKFGKGFKYFRPPQGNYSERTLAATQQLGYKTVFWSFAYDDWDVTKQRGADYAYNIVMKNLHNGAIFLLHAVSKDNAEALDSIIKGIRAEGYEIKLLDLE